MKRIRRFVLITGAALFCLGYLFAAFIAFQSPTILNEISVTAFVIFSIPLFAVVAVLLWLLGALGSRLERQIENITSVATEICSGAVTRRISLEQPPLFKELSWAYSSVNRLADKAMSDIAELKRLERVRSEFLANVSHELRTPIFAVQGFLETLLDGALEDEAVRTQFVEKAFSNTVRLNLLLTDLIDISRIESGEMRLSFRYFPLIPFLSETVRSLEAEAQANNVTLSVDIPKSDKITVYGDRDRLSQVMTNLIGNAIKYTESGGSVSVTYTADKNEAVVKVSDTGIGISPEHQERIFERFYRVDKGRSRAVGGTGLGLAIAKHIIEAHKSTISVESVLGEGATMSFTLKT